MRVTLHEEPTADMAAQPRQDVTRQGVYALKVEIEGRREYPEPERIEIAHGGAFYRIEPKGKELLISIVGVSWAQLVVCPQSANAVTISGIEHPRT